MENKRIDPKNINGWGIDADPENEPTYPMKNWTGDDHKRGNWQRPPLQKRNTEILISTERPKPSAVFGTPQPPQGLSGAIRRMAFKYSENMYRHWLPLILADRVNSIEGIIEDVKKGFFPNVYKEKGWVAIAKYNKPLLARKVVQEVLLFGTIAWLLMPSGKKKNKKKWHSF